MCSSRVLYETALSGAPHVSRTKEQPCVVVSYELIMRYYNNLD